MHDDQLRTLLRTLEDGREPDPAFVDALFSRLDRTARGDTPRRTPFLLLAAALLLTALAAGVAIGSGLVRLPFTVEASAEPSASGVAQLSPSASVDPSSAPTASVSAEASVAPEPVSLAGRVLFAEADGMRLRSEPSGSATQVETLRRGQLMGATGETASADGMDWYEVRIGPGNTSGWVAAGPDRSWLRVVDNGAVAFRCDGCAADTAIVSVTPFGDADITTIGGADLLDYAWSPDGSRLAMTVDGQIVVSRPDGSDRRTLGEGYGPRWSADGSRLAWSTGEGLMVTDDQLVPSPLDPGLRSPGIAAWSPDGSRLAVGAIDCPSCPPDEPIFGDPPSALYSVAVDGSDVLRMTGPDYYAWTDWAPDSSQLALMRFDLSGVSGTTAYTIPSTGGEPASLLDGATIYAGATWSPDGARMLLATEEGLMLLDRDGSNPQLLVPSTDERVVTLASWSPDGSHALFVAGGTFGEPLPGVWVVPVDDSEEPRQISPVDATAIDAAWQPLLAPLP